MKLETLLERIKAEDRPQDLDKNYDGHCPCFHYDTKIEGKELHVWGRCWRVSENDQDLHVWGELPQNELKQIAEALKEKLDAQEWYNPYTIIYSS